VVFITLIILLFVGPGAGCCWCSGILLLTLALATAMALLLRGVHLRLTAFFRGRPGLSALTIVLLAALIILVPLMGVLAAIATQALNFYQWGSAAAHHPLRSTNGGGNTCSRAFPGSSSCVRSARGA
jgi:predicted PurR-regulated permease PerM